MRALLDMDGLIADFVSGISRAHGRPDSYDDPAHFGRYEMAEIWGITDEEFWASAKDEDFLAELEPTAEAAEIVSGLTTNYGEDNVCILPSLCSTEVLAATTERSGSWRCRRRSGSRWPEVTSSTRTRTSGPASLDHGSAWDLEASRRYCSRYASTPGARGSGAMGSQGRHMARRYFPANWAK
jgi:hypothetical protein